MPRLLKLYDKLGYNYARHIFDVQATLTPNTDKNALDVEFSTIDNAPVYYTLDGSEPTETSTRYEGRFSIQEDATLKAVAIREGGENSRLFNETIKVTKSTYKPIELLTKPASGYAYTGATMLVDGLNGSSTNYRTGRWMGFQRDDLVAVIDMLEPAEISTAEIRTAVVTGDWIFNASAIEIATSDDNKHFTTVATKKIVDDATDNYEGIFTHDVSFDPVIARYFKVTVKTSVIPEWHPGKGGKGFIFVDEIRLD